MDDTEEKSPLELCLDFSNTIDWRNGRHGQTPKDRLRDYDNLVDWSKDHGLIRAEEVKSVSRLARESGKDASIFRRGIELREAIYEVFSAIAHKKRPNNHDLEVLNKFVSESMAQSKIVRTGDEFQWACYGMQNEPDSMLWPIARSAADLLTSGHLIDVRECANEFEGCGWLFLDESKSHTRKWCSMSGCGNVAKARRYYERHKGASA
jgi:predicted RNA-binding Zn ribbon-like protein